MNSTNYLMNKNYSPWENLALSIVAKAVEDYRWGKKRYNSKHRDTRVEARKLFHDAEIFLKSDYCEELCGVKGKYILSKLKDES